MLLLRTQAIKTALRGLSSKATPNPLQATFLRGGTSKGVFLTPNHLPVDRTAWAPILLGIMGSPDPQHGRQLNGMGGGISSLSKAVIVGPPTEEQRALGADVQYTFAQVGIREPEVDYSGNCGNLSSVVGIFAVDEGLCAPRLGHDASRGTVYAFNTNTNKLVSTTFPVGADGTPLLDLDEAEMAGVPGRASRIDLDFLNPAGARTGKLLPTGKPVGVLAFDFEEQLCAVTVRASLVDATNPSVLVPYGDLQRVLGSNDDIDFSNARTEALVEQFRTAGARAMGLDPAAKAQPKIAILRRPSDEDAHIQVYAFSMGVLHRAVPMTLGLCVGVAAKIDGSVAWEIVQQPRTSAWRSTYSGDGLVRLAHPSGVVEVGSVWQDGQVQSARVVRTGRRLMRGVIWW